MISNKRIQKLISDLKGRYTWKQFATSRKVTEYFRDLAKMLTRRYGFELAVRVKLSYETPDENGNDPYIAFTDNKTVHVNANNTFVRSVKEWVDKFDVIKGLFAHELGHVLFTDFDVMRFFSESIAVCSWYPERPKFTNTDLMENLADIEAFLRADKKNARRFLSVAHHLDNSIEDGFIEEAFMDKYPGSLCDGLLLVRETHWDEMKFVWQLEERTSLDEDDPQYLHPFLATEQILLEYAKYGEFKIEGDDELDSPLVENLLPALEYVDAALMADNALFRRTHVSETLVVLWPQIKEFLEWIASRPETEQEEASGSGSGGSGAVEKALKSVKGTSGGCSGKGKPVDGSKGSKSSMEKRDKTKEKAGSDGKGHGKGGKDSSSSSDSDEISNPGEISTSEGGHKEVAKTEEGGRIPEHDTEDILSGEDIAELSDEEEEEEEDEYDPDVSSSASDIEKLLEDMAEEDALESMEKERLNELSAAASGMNLGEAHKGIPITVRRITRVTDEMKEQYNSIAPPLVKISTRLQKLVKQKLKDKRQGGKKKNLYFGRKLESRALIREDGKVFYSKKLPKDAPEISVVVLLDESGSMSWGSRAAAARATAIVLYDFCKGLEIPCAVVGHTADEGRWGSIQVQVYSEFDELDKNDKYRLMDISARSNNRDGAALKYCYDKLDKRPEEVKLLFVVSDGQPAASGYSGSAAEADMRTLKNSYQRRGIVTFAAAIGSDKEAIERIYGDGFLDITDLEKLPEILTKLLLKYIKV